MRVSAFALIVLTACAQPTVSPSGASVASTTEAPPPAATTTATAAPTTRSPLAQQIRADMARLDGELSAEGVVAAGIGEIADLGGGLAVRPLAVKEDSRCPGDVSCVWSGRLVLRADISGTEQDIILGEPLATPHGRALLVAAKPERYTSWPTAEIGEPPAYRFGFRRQ